MRPINKIGVIGAGSMGQGIAQVCANSGYEVFLHDADTKAIERGIQNIGKNFDQAITKGKSTEEKKAAALQRIKSSHFEMLKVDLAIEAVIEKIEVKQKIFSELEKINDPSVIFATNTSSLSVSKIGSILKYPERFLGLHF